MTTTLSSAGGVSLVTDGTGPSLEIKGLSGGTGIRIDSSATSLTVRSAGLTDRQRFYDDFFYHTKGTTIDLANSANPFHPSRSLLWIPENSGGIGMDVIQTQEWPGGGVGVIKFNNNTRTGAGGWALKAKNVSFTVGGGDLSYEATLYFDTPSANNWIFKVGLLSPAIALLGFELDPTNTSYLRTVTPSGTTGTSTTISSLYGQWLNLKIVVNAALTSVQFYVNGTLVDSRSSLTNTYYIPVIYFYRSGSITTHSFYVDYVSITKDPR